MHLVAMQVKQEKLSCFWCCSVPAGLYNSCLGMLNLRCLAIVFDLDETLIVANTMKSFEDRIEFLQRKIASETDVLRAAGMKAELKRYLDDRALLKQYAEIDQVTDNGKLFKIQHEEVPQMSSNQDAVVRPVVRLNDKNIVLTRINPEVTTSDLIIIIFHYRVFIVLKYISVWFARLYIDSCKCMCFSFSNPSKIKSEIVNYKWRCDH